MGLTMRCWHDWLYQEMVGCTWQTIQNFNPAEKKHYFLRQFPLSNAHWQCSVVCLEFPSPISLMFIILISQFFWLKLPFLVVDAPHSWLPKNIAQARPDPAGASVLKFKPQRMKRRAALVGRGWNCVMRCVKHWTVWNSKSAAVWRLWPMELMLKGWTIRKKGHLGSRDTIY